MPGKLVCTDAGPHECSDVILLIPFLSRPEGPEFYQAQGNALGSRCGKKPSPERAEYTVVCGVCVRPPFQGSTLGRVAPFPQPFGLGFIELRPFRP